MSTGRTVTTMASNGTGAPHVRLCTQRSVPVFVCDQLLVRTAACGVSGHDLLARRGLLNARDGDVLGHEMAGRVEAVGPDGEAGWIGTGGALVQRRPWGFCEQCLRGHTEVIRPGHHGAVAPTVSRRPSTQAAAAQAALEAGEVVGLAVLVP